MGLLDRFKSGTTTTQQGLTANDWLQKGYALGKLNRYQEALQCYNKAVEVDPKNAAAWSAKGYALGVLGRYEEETQCYYIAHDLY